MPASDHVSVTVKVDSLGLARAGFGLPLILSHNAGFAGRIKYYSDLDGIEADSFATDSPEYLCAAAIFAQNPHPPQVAIGRLTGTVTQRFEVTPANVIDNHVYSIQVEGEGVTSTAASYTSDGTALLAEITAGITSALNGVVGKNFTAVDNGTSVTVTADASGNWFSLESLDLVNLDITQDHAAPSDVTLATDLAAISNEKDDWYAILSLYNSTAYVDAIFTYAETVVKLYLADSSDTAAINLAEASGTDVLDDIDENDLTRTAGFWHPSPADFFAARVAGRCLPLDPGTETWAYKTLTGIVAPTLTQTQRNNLQDRQATYYKAEFGSSFTWQGEVGDLAFRYIDLRRFVDKWVDDLQKTGVETFLNNDRVAYDDPGLGVLRGELRGVNRRLVGRGLAADPEPQVVVPKKSEIASSDIAARHVPGIKVSGTYQGAIHTVAINLVLSL